MELSKCFIEGVFGKDAAIVRLEELAEVFLLAAGFRYHLEYFLTAGNIAIHFIFTLNVQYLQHACSPRASEEVMLTSFHMLNTEL